MSYTVTYHGTVSGSKSASYPASEHGGSVTVHYSEPVSINIHVNTEAFDDSIDGCVSSVNTVGAILTATTAAQVKAKIEAGEAIGRTLVKGFNEYTTNLMSQDSVQLENQFKALFPEIQLFLENLQKIKDRMEFDFNVIKKRYVSIFDQLDEELNREMKRMYSALFDLLENGFSDCVVKRRLEGIGTTASLMTDIPSTKSMLEAVYLKKTFENVLVSISSVINSGKLVDKQIEHIASNKILDASERVFVPSFVLETDEMKEGDMNIKVYLPDNLSEEAKTLSSEQIHRAVIEGSVQIDDFEKDKLRIKQEFLKLLDNVSDKAQRNEMIRLFSQFEGK